MKGGGGANSGELSEGAGGTFGRLTQCNTAASQELLDCTHSKAHNFKKVGLGLGLGLYYIILYCIIILY